MGFSGPLLSLAIAEFFLISYILEFSYHRRNFFLHAGTQSMYFNSSISPGLICPLLKSTLHFDNLFDPKVFNLLCPPTFFTSHILNEGLCWKRTFSRSFTVYFCLGFPKWKPWVFGSGKIFVIFPSLNSYNLTDVHFASFCISYFNILGSLTTWINPWTAVILNNKYAFYTFT